MLKRYQKNTPLYTPAELELVHSLKICVIGCGGVGTQIIEGFARFGVKQITAVDKDVIDESDLNRLIHSNGKTIGESKASVMKRFIDNINDRINTNTLTLDYTDQNGPIILKNHDIVIDATGDLSVKRLIEKHAGELDIPMMYTYYRNLTGYLAWIEPNSMDLDRILSLVPKRDETTSKPIFTTSVTGNMVIFQILANFLNKPEALDHELLTIDISTFRSTRTKL
jgi:molybdopterin-synthase adenylyltransferase